MHCFALWCFYSRLYSQFSLAQFSAGIGNKPIVTNKYKKTAVPLLCIWIINFLFYLFNITFSWKIIKINNKNKSNNFCFYFVLRFLYLKFMILKTISCFVARATLKLYLFFSLTCSTSYYRNSSNLQYQSIPNPEKIVREFVFPICVIYTYTYIYMYIYTFNWFLWAHQKFVWVSWAGKKTRLITRCKNWNISS